MWPEKGAVGLLSDHLGYDRQRDGGGPDDRSIQHAPGKVLAVCRDCDNQKNGHSHERQPEYIAPLQHG
jgi:hypothetical protein